MDRSGLRVLVFQRLRGYWVARGLEHDLTVEGRSLSSVIDRIHRLVWAHAEFDRRHGRAPLSPFPAAPRRFWRAFDQATPLPVRRIPAGASHADLPAITVALSGEMPAEPSVRPVQDGLVGVFDRAVSEPHRRRQAH